MPKKPRIPDPSTVGKCETCGRSIGGKGYYGPECQCGVDLSKAIERAHSAGRSLSTTVVKP